MRILAFCFFPAFVPPSNGGQSRLFNFYRALSRWHQIILLTSTHLGVQEEVIQHGLNFVERRIPKDNYFAQKWVELEQYSGGGDLSGPTIAACGSLPTIFYQAYLEEYEKADAIIFDDPFTAQYDLLVGADKKPRIYNSYNCETLLYRQIHTGKKSKPIHDLVRAAEQSILENADLVLYCNEGDLEAFRLLAPAAGFDALYAPNGMNPIAATKAVSDQNGSKLIAVFMGSGHPPNVQAAEVILHAIAPACPDTLFHIIGSCLPEGVYPSNVTRHGVVDDFTKARLLSQADIALNPMAAGSGSNVKVLEYFAHGIPVLSTSFGMRGIRAQAGTHYLEVSLDNFSQALDQAIRSRSAIAAIGEAGKALALERYTWDAIARSVAHRLEALVDLKRHKGHERFVLALNDYDSFSGIGGGGTRTRGLYESVKDWCSVVFVSFSDDHSIGTRSHGEGITVINIPKTPGHTAALERVNAQFHISANDIVAIRHCNDLPPASRTTVNERSPSTQENDGHEEEQVQRRTNHWLLATGRGRHGHPRVVPQRRLQPGHLLQMARQVRRHAGLRGPAPARA